MNRPGPSLLDVVMLLASSLRSAFAIPLGSRAHETRAQPILKHLHDHIARARVESVGLRLR